MTEPVRPIIIRRKKVYAADGHHGGAWKVAYADFVTAMMAFFLLMWLLNATTEDQRKGIADHFSPNIPIVSISGGGSGALSGDSIFTQDTLIKTGTGAKDDGDDAVNTEQSDAVDAEQKDQAGEKSQNQIKALNEALIAQNEGLLKHVSLKLSPEGLVIELIDSDDAPLFSIGDTTPSDLLKELLMVVTDSFSSVKNNIKIVGHTDSLAFSNRKQYSNWELSTDRANVARRLLVSNGFAIEKVSEISGKAYTDPLSDNPLAAQNRRISITILQ